jgi:hypothetical protein
MKDVLTVEDDPSGRFIRLNASYGTTFDRTSGTVELRFGLDWGGGGVWGGSSFFVQKDAEKEYVKKSTIFIVVGVCSTCSPTLSAETVIMAASSPPSLSSLTLKVRVRYVERGWLEWGTNFINSKLQS